MEIEARDDWLDFEDRNTRYFHNKVNKRRRKNRILSLKMSDGNWCFEEEFIKN